MNCSNTTPYSSIQSNSQPQSTEEKLSLWEEKYDCYLCYAREAAKRIRAFINDPKKVALKLDCLSLDSLPDIWDDPIFTRLGFLSLRDNRLESLPERIWKSTSLVWLDLGRNKFKSLPELIGNATSLRKLDLSNNYLKSLPEIIGSLKSLIILNLNWNKLRSIPESIGKLMSLKWLDLSDNKLRSLPETIKFLPNLTTLSLEGNKIAVPSRINGNSSLSDSIPVMKME